MKEYTMRRKLVIAVLLGAMMLLPGVANASPADASCWGQASKVFAQIGAMGEHSSSFPTPRLGLRNLARALHEGGVISDDSMQALGAFVAGELGLEIDACS
jgi:hypothetical protein